MFVLYQPNFVNISFPHLHLASFFIAIVILTTSFLKFKKLLVPTYSVRTFVNALRLQPSHMQTLCQVEVGSIISCRTAVVSNVSP